MPGRNILGVILHDTINEFYGKRIYGVLFKIDFEKVYDQIKWYLYLISSTHEGFCIYVSEVGTRFNDNIGQDLWYFLPIHTTRGIPTSMKGPTGPSSTCNCWEGWLKKKKNARFTAIQTEAMPPPPRPGRGRRRRISGPQRCRNFHAHVVAISRRCRTSPPSATAQTP
jgi:hypothetical protein